MTKRNLVSRDQAALNGKKRKTKKDHAGKDWATLNTNAKFEIIGDDLRARGVID